CQRHGPVRRPAAVLPPLARNPRGRGEAAGRPRLLRRCGQSPRVARLGGPVDGLDRRAPVPPYERDCWSVSMLEIRDLHVSVDTVEILHGVDLTVSSGETHAIMGPNGSGKSTLAYSIAGHPKYTVTRGQILLDGQDVLAMTVDERARAGLFLAMQYPVEVPGVSVSNF